MEIPNVVSMIIRPLVCNVMVLRGSTLRANGRGVGLRERRDMPARSAERGRPGLMELDTVRGQLDSIRLRSTIICVEA